SVGLTNIIIHSVNGQIIAQAHFFGGPGLRELVTYVGIAVLACVGYGSVFLPAALQKISVVHYLQSIVPVPIPFGPFAVITAPSSVFTSVTGLVIFTF